MSRPALRLALALEDAAEAPDGAGGYILEWTALGTLWAEIKATPGRESMVGTLGVSSATHIVTVRGAPVGAPSRPTPRQRFRLGPRVFRIVGVSEADPTGAYLACRVVEEVAI